MASFYQLVLNENMKIYYRIRTWIMLSIIVIFSALMPFVFSLIGGQEQSNVWEVTVLSMSFTFFLNIIFSVVIAADSVASEFSGGTIKLLLIRPWSRSKILLSKYISVILFSLLSTLLLFGISFLSSNIWFGYEGNLGLNSSSWSDMTYTFMTFGANYIELLLIITIAFMISTLFRSNTFAISMSLLILFTKDILLAILNPDKYEWMDYVIFTHMNLSGYINSSIGPGGSTFLFSIVILGVYYVVFMLLAWVAFNKRDVST
ncbi:ABC transporter permease [Paenibacillus crassostreae]|nr:ABC transporter permease [Paenibacillus crassostreae]